jgi:hypothetical protein
LQIYALGEFPVVDITKDQFLGYKSAREVLYECLALEEKYEMLICNYLDLEREILDVSLATMLQRRRGYAGFFSNRLALDRRLANLLTTTKQYIDQAGRHVSGCLRKRAGTKSPLKSHFSKEYDAHPEYRFMEALRNHVQHWGTSVHLVSLDGRWTEIGDDGLLEYSTQLATQKSHLGQSKKFNKKVLNELSDQTDLLSCTRTYVESIGTVHIAARKLIASAVDESRNTINAARNEYASAFRDNLAGLSACVFSEGKIVESFPLLLEWDDCRIELQKRNGTVRNLKKAYVTGQLKRPKKKENHAG